MTTTHLRHCDVTTTHNTVNYWLCLYSKGKNYQTESLFHKIATQYHSFTDPFIDYALILSLPPKTISSFILSTTRSPAGRVLVAAGLGLVCQLIGFLCKN